MSADNQQERLSYYISGYVDGEGSFLVSFQKRAKMKMGLEVRPSFTVSQHHRSKEILDRLEKFFGCGSIRFNRSDQTYKYEVRSLKDLTRRIIPHFVRYPLKTTKQNDFLKFQKVCELMKTSKHLSINGLRTIIETSYTMNNFGARRYELRSLLSIVDKMKV